MIKKAKPVKPKYRSAAAAASSTPTSQAEVVSQPEVNDIELPAEFNPVVDVVRLPPNIVDAKTIGTVN